MQSERLASDARRRNATILAIDVAVHGLAPIEKNERRKLRDDRAVNSRIPEPQAASPQICDMLVCSYWHIAD